MAKDVFQRTKPVCEDRFFIVRRHNHHRAGALVPNRPLTKGTNADENLDGKAGREQDERGQQCGDNQGHIGDLSNMASSRLSQWLPIVPKGDPGNLRQCKGKFSVINSHR